MPKITIVGAGNVGATTAFVAAIKDIGDVVLIDIVENLPQGKALDMMQSSATLGFKSKVIGTNRYEDTKDSDIVVITAGVPRKPGMSRDDLLGINTKIVKAVTEQIAKYSPNCILIVVSNPLDAMVYVASETSKFPKNRIIGMAGVLDSSRFRFFAADAAKTAAKNTEAFVLGGHGDEMIPMPRKATINGKPIYDILDKENISKIVERTRNGGGEIVQLLGTSAYYAPAASILEMIEAILKDQKKALPCAAYLEGQYGVNGLFIGVLAKLGKNGVEEIIEVELTDEEKEQFNTTVEHVRSLVKEIKLD